MFEALDQDRCAGWSSRSGGWQIEIVAETGSTNADLLAAAAQGALHGTVLVAEHQSAGRGRLDRTWLATPYAGLTFSILLRPAVPISAWGWVPLIAGLGLHDAVTGLGVSAALKWPNDLQIGPDRLKAAGILVQSSGDAVVVGIGLNVHPGDLPDGAAAIGQYAEVDRTAMLLAILEAIAARYQQWIGEDGDSVRSGIAAAYARACGTLGQQVRVFLPGAPSALVGIVDGLDGDGRLLVQSGGSVITVGAGDVLHVRPGDTP